MFCVEAHRHCQVWSMNALSTLITSNATAIDLSTTIYCTLGSVAYIAASLGKCCHQKRTRHTNTQTETTRNKTEWKANLCSRIFGSIRFCVWRVISRLFWRLSRTTGMTSQRGFHAQPQEPTRGTEGTRRYVQRQQRRLKLVTYVVIFVSSCAVH